MLRTRLNHTVQYEYDAVGNRTAVVNPNGGRTTYTFDVLNRLLGEHDPLGNGSSYTYDENGNRIAVLDAEGHSTTWTYDFLNRIAQINYPETTGVPASTITFGYDAVGNRTSMTDTTGVTNYGYDELNRLTSLTNSSNQTVSYLYDDASRRTRITYPDGSQVNYGYDAANQLKTVQDSVGTTALGYDALGNRTSIAYPNGVVGTYAYDSASRLTGISYSQPVGGSLFSVQYILDKVGNRLQMVDSEGLTSYEYDSLYRLTKVTYPDSTWQQFAYDANGNRTALTDPAGVTNYTYNTADQLQTMTRGGTSTNFSWDKNGNMTSKDATQYIYDAANRLTKVTNGANTIEYAYDGDGRRTQKKTNGVVTTYLWDTLPGLPVILNETAGTSTTRYEYAGQLLSQADPDGVQSFIHADGLGSTRVLSAVSGDKVGEYNYEVYGATRTQIGSRTTQFQFTGQQADGETGLIYLRARYYDPAIGIFVSKDPVAFLTQSSYGYAQNNPTNLSDLNGQCPWCAVAGGVAGAIIGGIVKGVTYKYTCTLNNNCNNNNLIASVVGGAVSGGISGALVGGLGPLAGSIGVSSLIGGISSGAAGYAENATICLLEPQSKDCTHGKELGKKVVVNAVTGAVIGGGLQAITGIVPKISGPQPSTISSALGLTQYNVHATANILTNIITENFTYVADTIRDSATTLLSMRGSRSISSNGGGGSGSDGGGKIGSDGVSTSYSGYSNNGGGNSSGNDRNNQPAPGPVRTLGTSPNRPMQLQDVGGCSHNWSVRFQNDPPIKLCVLVDDPNIIAYNFQIHSSLVNEYDSGWIGSDSWDVPGPSNDIPVGTHSWRVQAAYVTSGNDILISDWSDWWNFTLADNSLSITRFDFSPSSPTNAESVNVYTCGSFSVNMTERVLVNTATDGSSSGDWINVGERGPCGGQPDQQLAATWNTLSFADGTHRVRVEARDNSWIPAWARVASAEQTFTLNHRRPGNPSLIQPAQNSWWNTRAINFAWSPATNANTYHLCAGTTSTLAACNLVDQTFNHSVTSYSATLNDDYQDVYWSVTAGNDLGSNGSGTGHFGLDPNPPYSATGSLLGSQTQTAFVISWAGSDDRSGLINYDVLYKDGENGIWQYWLVKTTATISLFTGQNGHTYYFQVVARDAAGNTEAITQDNGETFTTVNTELAVPTGWWNPDYKERRPLIILNPDSQTLPANYPTHLHFDSTTVPSAADLYNESRSPVKGDDLRIVYNSTTELNRYILRFTPTAVDLWFPVQTSIPTHSADGIHYALYIANSLASNPPADQGIVYSLPKDLVRVHSSLILKRAAAHIPITAASVTTEVLILE